MPRPLLRTFVCALTSFIGLAVFPQAVGINVNGAAPAASAMLDISNAGATVPRGLLIPRITEIAKNNLGATLGTDAEGLWVYQNSGTTGLYYWDGTTWLRWSTPTASGLAAMPQPLRTVWEPLPLAAPWPSGPCLRRTRVTRRNPTS